MIKCNTCRKNVPDDSEFCPFCGNKIGCVVDEHIDIGGQLHLYQPSALLTRAFLFIEEESFDKADNYLEAVLNQEPENAQAYLGKLMVELHVKCKKDLINCDTPFDCNKNYQKIVRFADKSLVDELEGYIRIIKERNIAQADEKRQENRYFKAVNDYNSNDIVRIQNAIKSFSLLVGYKDSDNFVELCKTKIEQIRIKEENDRVKTVQTAKRNKKILIFSAPVVIVLLVFVIVLNTVIIPNSKYNDALALMDSGKYEEAIFAFKKLEGYKNSDDKIAECEMSILENKYQAALSLLNQQKYTEAIVEFEGFDGYKDSATKIIACENAITQQYENKYDLSEYIEVTIEELWKNYSTYNGQKVKIVGYVGYKEEVSTDAGKYYDAFLVKDKTLSGRVTAAGGKHYWWEKLRLKNQYVGFRIMFINYLQHVCSGTPEVKMSDKIVLYGTFTYNPSTVDESERRISDPHGYDILVDHFFSMY